MAIAMILDFVAGPHQYLALVLDNTEIMKGDDFCIGQSGSPCALCIRGLSSTMAIHNDAGTLYHQYYHVLAKRDTGKR